MKIIRNLARFAVINAAIALFILFMFSGASWQTPWRQLLEGFSVPFLFGCCIAPLCAIALPRVAPMCSRRFTFPLNWVALLAMLFLLAATGSLIALSILAA